MILRALLVIASGFIFIFSPGLPMGLISRYSPDYKRDLVYWGIAAWLLSTLLNFFINSIFRQVLYQGQDVSGFFSSPSDFLFVIFAALLSALLLSLAMLLVLRIKHRRNPEEDLLANGMAIGFGAGLVEQVFTGITLVGAGFQILFNNSNINVTTRAIAESSMGLLLTNIVALILFRVALLAVNAVQGVLTARSLVSKKGAFWLGVLVSTLFTLLILALQTLIGGRDAGQVSVGITNISLSLVTAAYYLVAFLAAYRWLVGALNIKKK